MKHDKFLNLFRTREKVRGCLERERKGGVRDYLSLKKIRLNFFTLPRTRMNCVPSATKQVKPTRKAAETKPIMCR